MKNKIKHFIAKLLFGKPLIMAVYQDCYGDKFGGKIRKNYQYLHFTDDISHLKKPKFIAEVKIYI